MLRQYRDLLRNSAREDNDMTTQTIEMDSYRPRDGYFGKPYIDRDEYREKPWPHRNVHGGFENTDTRFTFYFPAEEEWGGRMYHPLEGAHAGDRKSTRLNSSH